MSLWTAPAPASGPAAMPFRRQKVLRNLASGHDVALEWDPSKLEGTLSLQRLWHAPVARPLSGTDREALKALRPMHPRVQSLAMAFLLNRSNRNRSMPLRRPSY